MIVAFAVQFIVLPYIVPRWHADDGLMVAGDWLEYHREAVELHDKILSDGWGEWKFQYSGHRLSGIMGALYVIAVPKPWVFIPIAAALHATAGLMVFMIMFRFVKSPRTAIVATLPFVLFPTALSWIAQPLKDGFSIAGFLLILYGWFIVVDLTRSRSSSVQKLLLGIVVFSAGLILVWISREYLLVLFQVMSAVIATITGVCVVRLIAARKINMSSSVLTALALGAILLLPGILPDSPRKERWSTESLAQVSEVMAEKTSWEKEVWIPSSIDGLLMSFARQRASFIRVNEDAGSSIDSHISFHRANDILKYIPRAAQIGLLAPFPNHWFLSAELGSRTVMRWVSSLEMLCAYIMIPFGLVGVWKWKRFPEMWILLFLCGTPLVIHPMFVPNVGTLMRLRYPYFMTLVCLGLAAFLTVAPELGRRIRRLMVR